MKKFDIDGSIHPEDFAKNRNTKSLSKIVEQKAKELLQSNSSVQKEMKKSGEEVGKTAVKSFGEGFEKGLSTLPKEIKKAYEEVKKINKNNFADISFDTKPIEKGFKKSTEELSSMVQQYQESALKTIQDFRGIIEDSINELGNLSTKPSNTNGLDETIANHVGRIQNSIEAIKNIKNERDAVINSFKKAKADGINKTSLDKMEQIKFPSLPQVSKANKELDKYTMSADNCAKALAGLMDKINEYGKLSYTAEVGKDVQGLISRMKAINEVSKLTDEQNRTMFDAMGTLSKITGAINSQEYNAELGKLAEDVSKLNTAVNTNAMTEPMIQIIDEQQAERVNNLTESLKRCNEAANPFINKKTKNAWLGKNENTYNTSRGLENLAEAVKEFVSVSASGDMDEALDKYQKLVYVTNNIKAKNTDVGRVLSENGFQGLDIDNILDNLLDQYDKNIELLKQFEVKGVEKEKYNYDSSGLSQMKQDIQDIITLFNKVGDNSRLLEYIAEASNDLDGFKQKVKDIATSFNDSNSDRSKKVMAGKLIDANYAYKAVDPKQRLVSKTKDSTEEAMKILGLNKSKFESDVEKLTEELKRVYAEEIQDSVNRLNNSLGSKIANEVISRSNKSTDVKVTPEAVLTGIQKSQDKSVKEDLGRLDEYLIKNKEIIEAQKEQETSTKQLLEQKRELEGRKNSMIDENSIQSITNFIKTVESLSSGIGETDQQLVDLISNIREFNEAVSQTYNDEKVGTITGFGSLSLENKAESLKDRRKQLVGNKITAIGEELNTINSELNGSDLTVERLEELTTKVNNLKDAFNGLLGVYRESGAVANASVNTIYNRVESSLSIMPRKIDKKRGELLNSDETTQQSPAVEQIKEQETAIDNVTEAIQRQNEELQKLYETHKKNGIETSGYEKYVTNRISNSKSVTNSLEDIMGIETTQLSSQDELSLFIKDYVYNFVRGIQKEMQGSVEGDSVDVDYSKIINEAINSIIGEKINSILTNFKPTKNDAPIDIDEAFKSLDSVVEIINVLSKFGVDFSKKVPNIEELESTIQSLKGSARLGHFRYEQGALSQQESAQSNKETARESQKVIEQKQEEAKAHNKNTEAISKEQKAIEAYVNAMKKMQGDSFNEAEVRALAQDKLNKIKSGDVESLMGTFTNGNKASNDMLKIMTGMPVNNQKNRDNALRSLNEEVYDQIIEMRENEKRLEEEANSFTGKWKQFEESIIGTNYWSNETAMNKGKIAKAFEEYGETAKEGLDYINKLWLSGQADPSKYSGEVGSYLSMLNDQAEAAKDYKNVKAGDFNVESLFDFGGTTNHTEETAQVLRNEAEAWDQLITRKREAYGLSNPDVQQEEISSHEANAEAIRKENEEIQKQIEECEYIIKVQNQWKSLTNIVDRDFTTGGKKEAIDQLRSWTRSLTDFRQREPQFQDRDTRDHINIGWYKAYEEAKNQKVANKWLSSYSTDIQEFDYKESLDRFVEQREFAIKTIEEQNQKIVELNKQLADNMARLGNGTNSKPQAADKTQQEAEAHVENAQVLNEEAKAWENLARAEEDEKVIRITSSSPLTDEENVNIINQMAEAQQKLVEAKQSTASTQQSLPQRSDGQLTLLEEEIEAEQKLEEQVKRTTEAWNNQSNTVGQISIDEYLSSISNAQQQSAINEAAKRNQEMRDYNGFGKAGQSGIPVNNIPLSEVEKEVELEKELGQEAQKTSEWITEGADKIANSLNNTKNSVFGTKQSFEGLNEVIEKLIGTETGLAVYGGRAADVIKRLGDEASKNFDASGIEEAKILITELESKLTDVKNKIAENNAITPSKLISDYGKSGISVSEDDMKPVMDSIRAENEKLIAKQSSLENELAEVMKMLSLYNQEKTEAWASAIRGMFGGGELTQTAQGFTQIEQAANGASKAIEEAGRKLIEMKNEYRKPFDLDGYLYSEYAKSQKSYALTTKDSNRDYAKEAYNNVSSITNALNGNKSVVTVNEDGIVESIERVIEAERKETEVVNEVTKAHEKKSESAKGSSNYEQKEIDKATQALNEYINAYKVYTNARINQDKVLKAGYANDDRKVTAADEAYLASEAVLNQKKAVIDAINKGLAEELKITEQIVRAEEKEDSRYNKAVNITNEANAVKTLERQYDILTNKLNAYQTEAMATPKINLFGENIREADRQLNNIGQLLTRLGTESGNDFIKTAQEIRKAYEPVQKIFAELGGVKNSAYNIYNQTGANAGQADTIYGMGKGNTFNEAKEGMQEYIKAVDGYVQGSMVISDTNKQITYSVKEEDGVLRKCIATWNETTGVMRTNQKVAQKQASSWDKMSEAFKGRMRGLVTYFTMYTSAFMLISKIKEGIGYVKELNTAITEMQLVTGKTDSQMAQFSKDVQDVANSVASTNTEITKSSTNWARLGYSMQDSLQLAKASAMYASVGFTDTETATSALTSVLQAFYNGVNDVGSAAESAVDKFVKIGNTFAITSAELGEGLQESASAIVAAGGSIDEAIALTTAGE